MSFTRQTGAWATQACMSERHWEKHAVYFLHRNIAITKFHKRREILNHDIMIYAQVQVMQAVAFGPLHEVTQKEDFKSIWNSRDQGQYWLQVITEKSD